MSLDKRFLQASESARKWKVVPPISVSLPLYSLFKQASVGDINIDKPGPLNLIGKYKWKAWNCRKGMSRERAMEEYIKLQRQYEPTYSQAPLSPF